MDFDFDEWPKQVLGLLVAKVNQPRHQKTEVKQPNELRNARRLSASLADCD